MDTREWREFRVGELFDIKTGKDLIYNDLENGEYPVVGHGVENNGIVCYTNFLEDYDLIDCKNNISLAHIGNFFATLQGHDFYLGTRTKALKLKNGKFNKYVALFICTIINQEQYRFTYGRVRSDKIPDIIINLPTTQQGEPDFELMEEYMRRLIVG